MYTQSSPTYLLQQDKPWAARWPHARDSMLAPTHQVFESQFPCNHCLAGNAEQEDQAGTSPLSLTSLHAHSPHSTQGEPS